MVTVDIWFDVVCPWCYVGKRRWETALAAFPEAERVRVRWRAFELRPGHSTMQGVRPAGPQLCVAVQASSRLPLTGRWLDFTKVDIVVDAAGTVTVRLLVPRPDDRGDPDDGVPRAGPGRPPVRPHRRGHAGF